MSTVIAQLGEAAAVAESGMDKKAAIPGLAAAGRGLRSAGRFLFGHQPPNPAGQPAAIYGNVPFKPGALRRG